MRVKNLAPVAALASAVVLAACSVEAATPSGERPAPQVDVAQPVAAKVADFDGYSGRFEAVERADVRARVSGYVKSVNFQDGARVKAGDLLFTLDDRPFRATLAQAEAQLASARVELNQAISDLDRSETLSAVGAVSVEELEQNRSRKASAEAAVNAARAGVDAAALDLSFTRVTAPISGRVSARTVDAGNLVAGGNSSGDVLTSIVRDDEMYFTFNVSEADYLRFMRAKRPEGAVSAEARLQDEADYSRSGEIVFADNQMGEATGAIRVRALIENADGLIRPGMTGDVRFSGSTPYEALMVPQTAVQTDGTRRILMVVNAKNEVEARNIELGPLSGNLRVISEGLKANDQVIVNGLLRARPGAVVDPVPVKFQYDRTAEDPVAVQVRPAMVARPVN